MIKVRDANELRVVGRELLLKLRRDIVQKIAEDSIEKIREDSGGKFKANLVVNQDGFVVGEIPKNENEKEEHLRIEGITQAYAKQYGRVRDESYLNNLLNKKG